MARYIKANRKVVTYLHLENDRNKLQDGNYILWLQDMMAFGPLPRLAETLERIGAISLLPHEAREEQYGITLRPLPTATDPEFVIETPAEEEPETEGNGETETPTGGEGTGESEAQAEAAEGNGETETPAEPETPTGEEAETETPANSETETPEEETPANGETTEETEESHEETQEAEGETGNDDNPNDTEE